VRRTSRIVTPGCNLQYSRNTVGKSGRGSTWSRAIAPTQASCISTFLKKSRTPIRGEDGGIG
jgi:hypothetical protein